MGDRKTNNFIQAYVEHYDDGFIPTKFHMWTAIATIAAALERKVWLPFGKLNFYPNLYVFLVANPGVGKSSAIRHSKKLLKRMAEKNQRIVRFLPNKVTEPKMLDILSEADYFLYKGTHYKHTSVYFIASEGSASFDDQYGGFIETLTALYDGDDITKATVSRPRPIEIINPCVNMIAGCTFTTLGNLLTTSGIMGGFASRITYVIQKDVHKRVSTWKEDTRNVVNSKDESLLIDDLADINSMTGPFRATPEFAEKYNEWFAKYDVKRQEIPNEKLQSLLARKDTTMKKLPLILSAAESSDRVLKSHHWDQSLKLMDEVESEIPDMIRAGQSHDTKSQEGINAAIINEIKRFDGIHSRHSIIAALAIRGFRGDDVSKTLHHTIQGGQLIKEINHGLVLVDDPNLYV